jgi:hypothetical protein
MVEGARRADYKPLRHPVSSLALGPRGWLQVTNFLVTGALYVAGAAGLARTTDGRGRDRLGATILCATGVGLLGSALFSTDPVSGYPPGTPNAAANSTTMTLHTLAAVPIFLGIPAASFASSWRFHRRGDQPWMLYSAATGVSVLATMGLAGAGFTQAPRLVNFAGLLQRMAIVTGFAWLTALCVWALR